MAASRVTNVRNRCCALNANLSNIAVQNASEDTGPITETGVNNIVPITLTSLTAALMMIELSNMIDYTTFEWTCYFKM